jgi:hypothetical protein
MACRSQKVTGCPSRATFTSKKAAGNRLHVRQLVICIRDNTHPQFSLLWLKLHWFESCKT